MGGEFTCPPKWDPKTVLTQHRQYRAGVSTEGVRLKRRQTRVFRASRRQAKNVTRCTSACLVAALGLRTREVHLGLLRVGTPVAEKMRASLTLLPGAWGTSWARGGGGGWRAGGGGGGRAGG